MPGVSVYGKHILALEISEGKIDWTDLCKSVFFFTNYIIWKFYTDHNCNRAITMTPYVRGILP